MGKALKDGGILGNAPSYGTVLLYSGKLVESKREYGVGLMLTTSVADRILTARSRPRIRNIYIVQGHASMESSDVEKKVIYKQLNAVHERFPNDCIAINLNAR